MATVKPIVVVGSYLSPFVRKVLVCLAIKGVDYQIDPLVPFYGNEEFSRISPLRRIPVLLADTLVLPDSAVICAYLDERYGGNSLMPSNPAERARARWLEHYAGTRLAEVFIWGLYQERVIKPFVRQHPPDEERIRQLLQQDIPDVMDFLELLLPRKGFLFGDISIADIAIAVFFRNAMFADYSPDAQRWPVTTGFVGRLLQHTAFSSLQRFEDVSIKTPVLQHRDALREAGAPLAEMNFSGTTPQPGSSSIG